MNRLQPSSLAFLGGVSVGLFAACALLPACSASESRLLAATTSWVGNSFGGGKRRVQQDIQTMVVTEGGTVYSNVPWDEAGREVGIYKNGDVIGIAQHTHGWGYDEQGEIAVPSVFFAKNHIKKQAPTWPPGQPDKGEWIWRDGNGNGAFEAAEYLSNGGKDAPPLWGWWVDSAGNVWQATQTAGIRKFTCQGLDARGNPIYNFASLAATPMPATFTRLERIYYFPATDTMYLAGYTADHPHHDGLWKVMGRVICRYDHWSKGPSSPRWQIAPDYTVDGSWKGKPASMSIAGDYVFVVYVVGGRIEVYDAQTGSSLGHLKPGPEVGGDLPGEAVGWVDIPEGTQAIRRSDGEYLVVVEEDWKSKILVYQWRPEAPLGGSR